MTPIPEVPASNEVSSNSEALSALAQEVSIGMSLLSNAETDTTKVTKRWGLFVCFLGV